MVVKTYNFGFNYYYMLSYNIDNKQMINIQFCKIFNLHYKIYYTVIPVHLRIGDSTNNSL